VGLGQKQLAMFPLTHGGAFDSLVKTAAIATNILQVHE
jgi:hypothetical protein